VATEADLIAREKDVTDRISTQVRTLAAGLIVFTWSIFNSADATFSAAIRKGMTPFLLLIDLFAIFALILDVGQYMLAEMVINESWAKPVKAATETEPAVYTFNDKGIPYRAQTWVFWLKQACCGAAVALTLVVVLLQVFVS
jgi:hypothetical protein